MTFTPSTPALIEITRQTYSEMITDDPQLSKTLLPEYFHYYASALLWLMIINLKQKNSQPLTEEEQDLLSFHPITNGGYYGTLDPPAADVDNNIYNFHEEKPRMGVTAEAVRRSTSDAPVGAYASDSSQVNRPVNRNLLGFKPLASRRAEAENLPLANDITPQEFLDYPGNSGFNFQFLQAISNVHSLTKTFKNTDMVFSTLSESVAQSQVVGLSTQANMNNLLGETRPTSLPTPEGNRSMGVTAEAVRRSTSDAPVGAYASDSSQVNRPVNRNLLGFKPLASRRAEAENLPLANDITPQEFLDYPGNSGFNFQFLQAISNVHSLTKTFKNTDMVFSTLSESVAQSQVVGLSTQANMNNLLGETRPTSLVQEQPSHYGSVVFFDSQLLKETGSFHPITNGGYNGTLDPPAADEDNNIHNFHEEKPRMGVTAEAVRRSTFDAPVGAYASDLSQFLQAISTVHSLTKTFKNTDMVFSTLSESVAQSQVVGLSTQANMNNLLGETRPTSLVQEQPSHYGSVVFFDSQLLKEPGVRDNHTSWCCITFQVAPPLPWINNRNARRSLPLQCIEQVFQSVSLNAMTYRINIIKQLVLSKR
ncbi:hypothetical protein JTB14_035660 [Gonioctena quinquepunctata]|nr:hypothetical protein JTB14_035660 [Gonioctena quinquepunctata]